MFWVLLLAIGISLFVLFYLSSVVRYYCKITFFYITIFLHGILCHILMIPSFIRQDGADVIFHSFRYWCLWTGIEVEVRGFDEHLKNIKGPAVVICNHQSAVDVVAMTHVWPPRGVVMMKSSLKYIPFFNTCSLMANCIFINRFNRQQAMSTVDQCVEKLTEKNLKLWIFPEGTRNPEGGLLSFKKGAFNIAVKAQIPIIPIVTSNYKSFYSKKDKYFLGDGEIIAEVLPPIDTKGKTEEDVLELAEVIRKDMLAVNLRISEEATKRIESKRAKKMA
ncbi:unnamed protein product [Auanema sp. JU1783]|nr:unnamed protein product [Auanema sp. JU1783]